MTDDKIVSKQIIEVEGNTMYEFSLISLHYGEFTSKGMVFYVKLFDERNKEINNRIFLHVLLLKLSLDNNLL